MTKKENKSVKEKRVEKNSDSKTETKQSKKEKFSFKKQTEKFNFESKITQSIIAVLFIILSMWVAWDVRDGPINLDGLEQNIQGSIYQNIQGVISQQIDSQYPNLNEIYKQEKVQKEFLKVQQTGKFNFNGQEIIVEDLISEQAQVYKQQFQAENGQTYLTAIDPYHFLKYSKLLNENGFVGDSLDENNNPVLSYKVSPSGLPGQENPEFHVWLESKLFEKNNINENSSIGELTSVIFKLSAIFATLATIPIFLIIRKYSNNLLALFGTLILLTIGTFVSRTVAGFVDTDAYQITFPLFSLGFLIYGLSNKNKILNITYTLFSGLSLGFLIWSWNSGWFMFAFSTISLIVYLLFEIISNLITKNKNLKENLTNQTTTLITYLLSSFIFVKSLANVNIFTHTIKGITKGLAGVTSIEASNIWPNVLTSVAELNPASFGQIVNSVGGSLVFLIALVALTLLAIDFKTENKKQNLIRRIIVLTSIIWTLIFMNTQTLINLTANHALVFIVLLFIPVGLSLLWSLINGNTSNKIFMSILLSIWMAGTIYMSLNGVRFILLLAPAFAISAGIGLYYIYQISNTFFEKELKPKSYIGKRVGGTVLATILFLVVFMPQYSQAQRISDGSLPNFNDQWYDAMEKIKTESSEDAIITSWWDFGHFFATVGDRGVTFDGGSQTTPRAHWVGKLLMENDEAVAQDILQMLVCGGNEAHNTFLSFTKGSTADAIKINKVLYKTFGKSNEEAKQIISNNSYYELSNEQVDEIMELLACETPRENLLITSNDMIGKAGVWAHWGSWDFTKKYTSDYYLTKSAEQIASEIDENQTQIQKYINELKDIDLRAKVQGTKRTDLINQWYAPYPSYVPIQGQYYVPCEIRNNTQIACAQGITVESDGFDMKVKEILNNQITIKNIVYPSQIGTLRTSLNDENGQFDIMLIPNGNGYQSVLAQSPLGASLFSRLYFYNGFGTTHFELFDAKVNGNNNPLTIWTTLWEPKNESQIIQETLERLQPQVSEIQSTTETSEE